MLHVAEKFQRKICMMHNQYDFGVGFYREYLKYTGLHIK